MMTMITDTMMMMMMGDETMDDDDERDHKCVLLPRNENSDCFHDPTRKQH